eukprot:6445803-Amphidinium_carterae.2
MSKATASAFELDRFAIFAILGGCLLYTTVVSGNHSQYACASSHAQQQLVFFKASFRMLAQHLHEGCVVMQRLELLALEVARQAWSGVGTGHCYDAWFWGLQPVSFHIAFA